MLRATLSGIWSRKYRLIGTGLAIILGVGFLMATLVLGDSAKYGFRNAFTEGNSGIDALVRSSEEFTGGEGQAFRSPIDANLIDRVRTVDGVGQAEPVVDGLGQVVDSTGDTIGGAGPPTVAGNWITNPAIFGWKLAEGRPPAAAGEVVMDRQTAEKAKVGLGGKVTVLVPDAVQVTVVGIATYGEGDSIGGATFTFFTTEEAKQRLLGTLDKVTGIRVTARKGLSESDLVTRLRSALPMGIEAISATDLTNEQQKQIEDEFLGMLTTGLLIFALIAVVVAAFSIFNTFSILAAQRTRESALLRALGASRGQVLLSSIAECGVVGVIGSVIGVGVGVLLASGILSLMEQSGFGLPTAGLRITPGSIIASLLLGTIVSAAGGMLPAWRSARVAPLAALREVDVDESAGSRIRLIFGAVGALAGAALVLSGTSGDGGLPRAGFGSFLMLIGVLIVGPTVARPMGKMIGLPLKARGVPGDLARRNAVRNPRRTSATAAALLVGVAIVSLFTVFGASISSSIEDAINQSFGGDLVLTPSGAGFSGAGISTAILDQLEALPEVDDAAGLGFGAVSIDGRQEGVGFADPQRLDRVADYFLEDGKVEDIGNDKVAISTDYADEHKLRVGDRTQVQFTDGTTQTLSVAATYDDKGLIGPVLMPAAVLIPHTSQASYFLVLVGLGDGVSVADGRAAVEKVIAGSGRPDIKDRQEFIDSQAASIDILLTVVYSMLGIAIVIALMGIANTISLSVYERTRELGLLRAVGQTRPQLRAMIRWEAVIVATFGAIGGLCLGVFLGWGLVRALNEAEGFGKLAVPIGSLASVLVLGAFVGVIAGARPAWRAAKMPVLTAAAAEGG